MEIKEICDCIKIIVGRIHILVVSRSQRNSVCACFIMHAAWALKLRFEYGLKWEMRWNVSNIKLCSINIYISFFIWSLVVCSLCLYIGLLCATYTHYTQSWDCHKKKKCSTQLLCSTWKNINIPKWYVMKSKTTNCRKTVQICM